MVIIKSGSHILPKDDLKQLVLRWSRKSARYPFFEGTSKDLSLWFSHVEEACREIGIHESQYTDAALILISGDLHHVMEERQNSYLEKSGKDLWEWQDFQSDLGRVVAEGERIAAESSKPESAGDAMARFRREHPYIVASGGVGLMIGGSLVLLPALGILALSAIGFTAGGVAAGSLAAALQSIFWGGATGGLFSILQSVAATAVFPAASAIIGAGTAVGTGIASVAYGANATCQRDQERPFDHRGSEQADNELDTPPPYESVTEGGNVGYAVYRSGRTSSYKKL